MKFDEYKKLADKLQNKFPLIRINFPNKSILNSLSPPDSLWIIQRKFNIEVYFDISIDNLKDKGQIKSGDTILHEIVHDLYDFSEIEQILLDLSSRSSLWEYHLGLLKSELKNKNNNDFINTLISKEGHELIFSIDRAVLASMMQLINGRVLINIDKDMKYFANSNLLNAALHLTARYLKKSRVRKNQASLFDFSEIEDGEINASVLNAIDKVIGKEVREAIENRISSVHFYFPHKNIFDS